MTIAAESSRAHRSLLDLLKDELAPREGRWAAVSRIALGSTLAVVIAMVFQIPQPTYLAYIVFAVSKDAKNATVTAGFGAAVAVTLAVILTLGLSIIDTGEPALRLGFMALATFGAMFTSRTFSLGPISYLAGFVIVLLQSLVDDVRGPEALTRAVLWTWVIVLVPVAITVLVNLLFGKGNTLVAGRAVRKVLSELAAALDQGTYPHRLAAWRTRLVPLLDSARPTDGLQPESIAALLDALVILEGPPTPTLRFDRGELAHAVRSCLRTLDGPPIEPKSRDDSTAASPAMYAFLNALRRVRIADEAPAAAPNSPIPPPASLLVADAFSNPTHWQFALKTTIAVMLSYIIYTLLDWPGLRTAIVTCFFVALGTLGETEHKLTLRLLGASVGGLMAALCIVFVFPHLTDIGQLCLVMGAVSMIAAWVATSSEILAYGGMQIAFAFFLGSLQGYAPASDLTVLRDRIAGILLGNIIITGVFSTLWPVAVRSAVRTALTALLRSLSGVFDAGVHAQSNRTRVVQALVRAEHLRALSLFELRMLPARAMEDDATLDLDEAERLAAAAFIITSEPIAVGVEREYTDALARWALVAAQSVAQQNPIPPGPAARDARTPLARAAIAQLELEVQRVISATR